MSSAPSIPPLHSWSCVPWLGEKQHHMLDFDSEHIQPPGEPYPNSARYYYLVDTITEFSKGHPPFYQASCFGMVRNVVGPVNSDRNWPIDTFPLL